MSGMSKVGAVVSQQDSRKATGKANKSMVSIKRPAADSVT